MYEMLGLSVSNFAEVSAEPTNIESETDQDFEEIDQDTEDADAPILSSADTSSVKDYNNELVQSDNIISPLKNIGEFQDESGDTQVAKKPFLKRGSGLTARFRIPPDAFNLKKLPKYKYADRVKKNLIRKGGNNAVMEVKKPEIVKKNELPLKKKEALVQKKEVIVPIVLTQESSELIPPKNVALKIPAEPTETDPIPQIQEWFNSRSREPQPEMSETPKTSKLPKGVSWSQILSCNNIMDSSVKVDHLLNPENLCDSELSETGLFHLLEERVHNMSLDTSMSSLMKLIATLQKPQDSDRTLVNPEDPIIDDSTVNLQLQPHPSDVNKKVIIDDTTTEDEEEEENHVRFSDDIEVVNDATDMSTDVEAIELSQTSTPNERKNFQEFKRKFLGHKMPGPSKKNQEDLKEKSEKLRQKLLQLEGEIALVREESSSVNKAQQDLELDRLQLENDREDMMEKMKDDRIKMELQLHDERLKVEQEKQKIEKMLKNPSKKEREEIVKLKESIEELKEELKTKEARHGSTSARYRSQVKVLEKENQSLKLELEVVKKDNKKLELENARLRKDTNNKMLQEINKNIAKLAPPAPVEVPKKLTTRKSEPIMKKRVKSVPELHVKSSSDSSDDEQVTSRKSFKENNPVRVRRSDPPRKTPMPASSDVLAEMKREIVNGDGGKDIWYPNGNLKKISPDGMLIRMLYFNKDIKETNINEGTVKYYYSETNTWHTTYIDGLEILEYPE
jgi:centromere protein J